jgi:uncharacterized membrane protein
MAAGNAFGEITDISDVAGIKNIERHNTMSLTKKTEIRSKTMNFIIYGLLAGILFSLCTYWLINYVALLSIPLFMILFPFIWVGETHDGREQTRWERWKAKRRSQNMHGGLLFANTPEPVNLTEAKITVVGTRIMGTDDGMS